MEWDYGSDIGYLDGQPSQVQAAQSLSTLEKLAIGNYSDILRESDSQAQMHDIHSRDRRRGSRGIGNFFSSDKFSFLLNNNRIMFKL